MKDPINVCFMNLEEKTERIVWGVKDMCNTVAKVVHSQMRERNVVTQICDSPASSEPIFHLIQTLVLGSIGQSS